MGKRKCWNWIGERCEGSSKGIVSASKNDSKQKIAIERKGLNPIISVFFSKASVDCLYQFGLFLNPRDDGYRLLPTPKRFPDITYYCSCIFALHWKCAILLPIQSIVSKSVSKRGYKHYPLVILL